MIAHIKYAALNGSSRESSIFRAARECFRDGGHVVLTYKNGPEACYPEYLYPETNLMKKNGHEACYPEYLYPETNRIG